MSWGFVAVAVACMHVRRASEHLPVFGLESLKYGCIAQDRAWIVVQMGIYPTYYPHA